MHGVHHKLEIIRAPLSTVTVTCLITWFIIDDKQMGKDGQRGRKNRHIMQYDTYLSRVFSLISCHDHFIHVFSLSLFFYANPFKFTLARHSSDTPRKGKLLKHTETTEAMKHQNGWKMLWVCHDEWIILLILRSPVGYIIWYICFRWSKAK